jgi:hypothetical protein
MQSSPLPLRYSEGFRGQHIKPLNSSLARKEPSSINDLFFSFSPFMISPSYTKASNLNRPNRPQNPPAGVGRFWHIGQIIIRHFDSPAIQTILDDGFVPHGYPVLPSSATTSCNHLLNKSPYILFCCCVKFFIHRV